MHQHRRCIINTHPRRGTNSKQLYSKYARLIDDYEYSIGDEALQHKQTILDTVNNRSRLLECSTDGFKVEGCSLSVLWSYIC